jgi:hypothetical protein
MDLQLWGWYMDLAADNPPCWIKRGLNIQFGQKIEQIQTADPAEGDKQSLQDRVLGKWRKCPLAA